MFLYRCRPAKSTALSKMASNIEKSLNNPVDLRHFGKFLLTILSYANLAKRIIPCKAKLS